MNFHKHYLIKYRHESMLYIDIYKFFVYDQYGLMSMEKKYRFGNFRNNEMLSSDQSSVMHNTCQWEDRWKLKLWIHKMSVTTGVIMHIPMMRGAKTGLRYHTKFYPSGFWKYLQTNFSNLSHRQACVINDEQMDKRMERCTFYGYHPKLWYELIIISRELGMNIFLKWKINGQNFPSAIVTQLTMECLMSMWNTCSWNEKKKNKKKKTCSWND